MADVRSAAPPVAVNTHTYNWDQCALTVVKYFTGRARNAALAVTRLKQLLRRAPLPAANSAPCWVCQDCLQGGSLQDGTQFVCVVCGEDPDRRMMSDRRRAFDLTDARPTITQDELSGLIRKLAPIQTLSYSQLEQPGVVQSVTELPALSAEDAAVLLTAISAEALAHHSPGLATAQPPADASSAAASSRITLEQARTLVSKATAARQPASNPNENYFQGNMTAEMKPAPDTGGSGSTGATERSSKKPPASKASGSKKPPASKASGSKKAAGAPPAPPEQPAPAHSLACAIYIIQLITLTYALVASPLSSIITLVHDAILLLVGPAGSGTRPHWDRGNAYNLAFALHPGDVGKALACWLFVHPSKVRKVDCYLRRHVNGYKDGLRTASPPPLSVVSMKALAACIDAPDKCFIVEQQHGSVVKVPAKWLHAVTNVRPCLKLAFDWIDFASLPAAAGAQRLRSRFMAPMAPEEGHNTFGGDYLMPIHPAMEFLRNNDRIQRD